MALALPPPMDYALDDDLGFFGRVFDMEMVKPGLAALGGGAVGGVAYGYISDMDFFDSDLKKGLLAFGLGFAGARALWGDPMDVGPQIQMRRDMAKGHLGVMGYVIGEKIVKALQGMVDKKDSDKDDVAPPPAPEASSGGEGLFGYRAKRGYLADADVQSEHSFADVDVTADNPLEDDLPVSSWIS